MRVLTAAEMQSIDRETSETYGLYSNVLMERAGISSADRILQLYPNMRIFVVLCGPGNNGGDGLVVARELKNRGYTPIVYLFADPHELRGDALNNYKIAIKYGVLIKDNSELPEELPILRLHRAVVIDALFGTGLKRQIEGPPYAEAIEIVNQHKMPTVSIDIPSGVCADTGRIMGVAIKADYTITFGLPKYGHFIHPGCAHTGRLFVEDIGFPKSLTETAGCACLIDKATVSKMIPPRPVYSNKHDYGHVLLVAGSRGKTGAALMAARAAMRAGCGLLTLAMPASAVEAMQGAVVEEMTLPLDEDMEGRITLHALDRLLEFADKRASMIAIGPGLGLSEDIIHLVQRLVKGSPRPMVIDADGLNALSKIDPIGTLQQASSPVVITPHEGEMARLMGADGIQDRVNTARGFAKESGALTVLKGVPTLISTETGSLFINTTGNAGMATGGTGDVLTGIVSALIAQGLTVEDASVLGVYIHGLAGNIAAKQKGMLSLIATDIINSISEAFIETCNS